MYINPHIIYICIYIENTYLYLCIYQPPTKSGLFQREKKEDGMG